MAFMVPWAEWWAARMMAAKQSGRFHQQYRPGTPARLRRGKHRNEGPVRSMFEPATIHMLTRAVNKGFDYRPNVR